MPPTPARSLREARRRIADFEASGAVLLAGRSVWGVPEPGVLLLTGGSPARVRARAVVLATGAYDRPVAFPGWTLPGAMTAGGAQALAKGQGVLPGKRVLLAGAGPFLLPVAAQLQAGGAEIVAIAEATRRRDWLAAAPRMAGYPGRLVEYARYRTSVRRIAWGHVIVRAEGDGRVQRATIAKAGPDWAPAGASAPSTSTPSAPPTASRPRSSSPGRSAASCARTASRTTTTCARAFPACSSPARPPASAARTWRRPRASSRAGRRRRRRAGRAARAPGEARGLRAILSDLFDPRPGLLGLATPTTVLCRCEDVTAGAVDDAVAGGATRCRR